ncbi:GNAT family N-acetyltransferase [Lentisphaerota bacterium WC36G]|nr:GNAT family N-acetyltransferase [Lentisphaerae bacterium WC36]
MYYCRIASEQDIPCMVLLLKQLTEIETDFQFDAEAHYDALEQLIECSRSLVVVAVNNETNKVIGMITGQVMISTAVGGNTLFIDDLVVNEKFRGNGIGEGLLNYLTKKADESFNIKRMQLCADVQNEVAFKFYDKLQWQNTNYTYMRKYL